MKKAAKVMYILAIVWSCFNFLAVVGMIGGVYVMKHYPDKIANFALQHGIEELDTVEEVLKMVNPVIIAAVVAFVSTTITLIFGIRALKALDKNEKNSTPQIVALVLGVVCGELFYLLGGIFGTVNASQNKTQEPPQANIEAKTE